MPRVLWRSIITWEESDFVKAMDLEENDDTTDQEHKLSLTTDLATWAYLH